jgi:cation transport ATPase
MHYAPGGTVFTETMIKEGRLLLQTTKIEVETKINSIVRYLEEL